MEPGLNPQPKIHLDWEGMSFSAIRVFAERVADLFGKGFDQQHAAAGIHGTNLEAVCRMLQLGVLPPGDVETDHSYQHLYFAAVEGVFPRPSANLLLGNFSAACDEAKAYAQINGEEVHFMKLLGCHERDEKLRALSKEVISVESVLPRAEPWKIRAILSTQVEDAFTELHRRGFSIEQLSQAAHAAVESHGVLLLVKPELFTDYELKITDFFGGKGDPGVLVPQGMPLDYIIGIEALGNREFEFFEKLQESLVK